MADGLAFATAESGERIENPFDGTTAATHKTSGRRNYPT